MTHSADIQVLEGRHVVIHEDGSRTFGVEDATKFPVGSWTNLYVPTDRLDEVRVMLDAIGTGAGRIVLERHRQSDGEGYHAAIDDTYVEQELQQAAIAYIAACDDHQGDTARDFWPQSWLEAAFKPASQERNLERAGALVAAELDRLDRKHARLEGPSVAADAPPSPVDDGLPRIEAPRGPISYDPVEIARRTFERTRDGYVDAIRRIDEIANSEPVQMTEAAHLLERASEQLRSQLADVLLADVLGDDD
ncbi:hypothetical protein [Desertimonas flava]|uniref:hypothetical protein n=1 Tax=Desertimonas flava TaxID=2064846 RepID=UPI0013C3F536|nr:hypothetical protein [Desertimonas flava]